MYMSVYLLHFIIAILWFMSYILGLHAKITHGYFYYVGNIIIYYIATLFIIIIYPGIVLYSKWNPLGAKSIFTYSVLIYAILFIVCKSINKILGPIYAVKSDEEKNNRRKCKSTYPCVDGQAQDDCCYVQMKKFPVKLHKI
jgi:hypothetical protein